MTKFKPVKQIRVSEEVFNQLKQAILLGHFKAGEKLPSEKELMDEFRVSRVAVREAIRALENSGFILTRAGAAGGAYVIELTFGQVADSFLNLFLANKISIPELYSLRLLVEPEIARLAALAITPEHAKRLKEALDAEHLPTSSLMEDIERKIEVHLILASLCGNRFFEAILRAAMKLTHRVIEVVSPTPYTLHPAGMHDPIVEAVIAGDAEAAFSRMQRHAAEFGEILVKMEKAYREKTTLNNL